MTEIGYSVKTDVFEGPLDLLLHLIEKRKLFINDISLAEVTDDFIANVYEKRDFPVSTASAFLVTASTLLLIKSRSLLPYFEVSSEEEESMDELERRLKLYRRMRMLSNHVRDMLHKHIMYARLRERHSISVFTPTDEISAETLRSATWNVLKQIPKAQKIPEAVVEKIVSLEDRISDLTKRIARQMSISFKEYSKIGREKKMHVIVSFLALLELTKRGIVSIKQDTRYADINIDAIDQN